MTDEACCTCAALLSSIPPTYDEKTEKPAAHERRLDCCGRAICARCTSDNPRFRTYCPFCQISTQPTPIPNGLRDPPPYSPPSDEPEDVPDSMMTSTFSELPRYHDLYQNNETPEEKPSQAGEDVLHFVDHANDSINTLAIRYGVPQDALRRKNNIFQDHLLAGRRTILIPGEFYKGGVSLSPRPIEGEEEELRKSKIRKWMVACKVHEYVDKTPKMAEEGKAKIWRSIPPKYRYDIAELYLNQADYDLDAAVKAYKEDEDWAEKNPMNKGKAPAKSRNGRFRIGGGLTGQLT